MFIFDSAVVYLDSLLLETATNVSIDMTMSGNPIPTLRSEFAGIDVSNRVAKVAFGYLFPNKPGEGPGAPRLPKIMDLFTQGDWVKITVVTAGGLSFVGDGFVTGVTIDQQVGGHLKLSLIHI